LWGLSPIYWRLLRHVDSRSLVAHRVVWSAATLVLALSARRMWPAVRDCLRDRRSLLTLCGSACLIAGNWGIFVWAVNHDRVLAASLGYYLTPLLNVLFGLLLFRERLTRLQWVALALAIVGVANQVRLVGGLPWVSLGVGASFAAYAALRKLVRTETTVGLFVETLILSPAAVLFLLAAPGLGAASGFSAGRPTALLVLASGPVTVAPLILYVTATRRLPMTLVGLTFYTTPTLYFLTGVFLYREPMTPGHLVTFAFIWTGLAVYSLTLRSRRPA
jgi:chloramphenicol-sensitive protein RarD